MISVYGEGLIDLVPTASAPLASLQPALGGGPYNVAVAAARQGADVAFHSRLSTDTFGQALVDNLRAEGVSTDLVQRGAEPTTLAVTSINESHSAHYTFYVDGTADRLATPTAATAPIACFGTCSLALEPAASRYAEVLRTLAARGTLIALDPNIRDFYATEQHRDFLRALLPDVTLLKLSEEEVEFLGGAERIDVPVMVITRGGEGLSVRTPTAQVDVPAVPVTVVDTIGAGDTILASLVTYAERHGWGPGDLAGLTEEQWREVLRFAATAAAITCSRVGAQPPTREEVLAALD
ncbi:MULTISPECIES: carbohydrate kinase [unclassified Corynebacterium]|uniref:carbohydrate kinase family protein n=1 Tax=unclassified Corynebacterium TaxID=2624378 RepID=UPI0029CA7650|nr:MULTISPECIES: carbohydrate kinase [unclassified Corynebacterium]WPF66489.1 carbohydrate kinase [Corynebacterium sp. 22KM0430]WPF68978.1 carbohydrate kinase [Corynebacterium sp. 21KM1197]